MKLSDFDYDLPEELIAQAPAAERTASRLLHLHGGTGALQDRMFREIPELITAPDVLVLNDTRVIKARLAGRRRTGGKIEILIERVLSATEAEVQMRASHPRRAGERITIADALEATVLERSGGFFRLRFDECDDLFAVLDRYGEVPLPPYITHTPEASDEARYQTVYARERGAVAAPTAGLHFDERLLDALRANGVAVTHVTLHVGAGTFQPVREDVATHEMHAEWYRVPQETVDAITAAKARGGRVVAAGTTTLRALESAGSENLRATSGETKLFIVPGYRFRVVERLITNFHLPRSTLLMLVSAFAGYDNIRRAYRHAIDRRYRFYSYGDAMLIERMQ